MISLADQRVFMAFSPGPIEYGRMSSRDPYRRNTSSFLRQMISACPGAGVGLETRTEAGSARLQPAAYMTMTALGPRAYRAVVVFCLIGALLADGHDRQVRPVGTLPILAIFSFAGYLSRTNLRPVGVERVLALAASSKRSTVRLRRIAEERGALDRVATLAAHGVPAQRIFDAVAGEMARLLRADHLAINRVEPDHATTVVGQWAHPDVMHPLSGHWAVEHGTIEATVIRTGQPARGVDYDGNRATYVVVCPITVDGRIWGTVTHCLRSRPQPEGTEQRMLQFVQFVGAAMADSGSRAKLLAARARAVARSTTRSRRP